MVDRLRAHLPNCKIDWCSGKKGRTNASLDNWYPGGDWVDFVGHDKYDWYLPIRNQAEWDADYNSLYLGGPRGIGAWLSYAKSKGKKLSVSEWAIVSNDPNGGGDNAYLSCKRCTASLKRMPLTSDTSATSTLDIRHRLQDNPAASKKYRYLY